MCRSLDSLLHPHISTLIFHTVSYTWQGEFVEQSRASLVDDNYLILVTMGFQTSQYSLCISVTQFTFYTVSSTFYTVNFLLFIWSTRVLCGQLFTFDEINFYFLYGWLNFLYGQLFTFYIGHCKTQTVDCRPWVKCRLRLKCRLGSKTTRFPGKTLRVCKDRGRVSCERLAIIVIVIDVSDFISSDSFGVDIFILR